MKTLIITIVCAFLFISCKKHQTEYHRKNSTCNIDLSKASAPSLFDYFSKIELISLETSDSCLIKIINGFTYSNKNFYLLDKQQKQVLVFDAKGNYRYKINKRGNGPGEYTDLSAFQINRFSGDFELLVPMGGILKYDSLGQTFKGKIPLPLTVSAAHDFIALDNNTYLFL